MFANCDYPYCLRVAYAHGRWQACLHADDYGTRGDSFRNCTPSANYADGHDDVNPCPERLPGPHDFAHTTKRPERIVSGSQFRL